MIQMPGIHSKVYYFPQGHAEQANGKVDFRNFAIPPLIMCRVAGIDYMADPETDEVFAKMFLNPLKEITDDDFEAKIEIEKPKFFAMNFTQSDLSCFCVDLYCATFIFPELDYALDHPIQNISAKDVFGKVWEFSHTCIKGRYGITHQHYLINGWSNFVEQKKLVVGDSVVFLKADNGDLSVGIRRRPKKQIGNVSVDSVIDSSTRAANGELFEVVYYPRAAPEFCVNVEVVRAATRIQWCPGMRLKLAFESEEDPSQTHWYSGMISSVKPLDSFQWPFSPWRSLEVELGQNVTRRVSPWLVKMLHNNIPSLQETLPWCPRMSSLVFLKTFSHLKKKKMMPPSSENHFNDKGNESCLLRIGNHHESMERNNKMKIHIFLLALIFSVFLCSLLCFYTLVF